MEVGTMLLHIESKKITRSLGKGFTALFLISLASALVWSATASGATQPKSIQKTFTSPEEAVSALLNAVKADDKKELSAILGPEGKQLISSGDEVADKNTRNRFIQLYDEKNVVAGQGDNKAVLDVGNDAWPFPIPIVKSGANWRFDTEAGKQEILNRRIGINELSTIQTCLAYVDAQREYASKDRTGVGLFEYAQKLISDPGKKNGLYWETGAGEEESPMGILVANAKKEGYLRKNPGDKPSPYHGYYYKILTAQGKDAPGGAYDYIVKGRMIGGFALVAYPAEYGSSGIMTFIVSHGAEVYQKDLGKQTTKIAQAMKTFDPDKTWQKVEAKYLAPPVKAGGAESPSETGSPKK
jgi:hypothetical protein